METNSLLLCFALCVDNTFRPEKHFVLGEQRAFYPYFYVNIQLCSDAELHSIDAYQLQIGVPLPIDDEYPDALVQNVDILRREDNVLRIQFKLHTSALNINELDSATDAPSVSPTAMPSTLLSRNRSNVSDETTGTPTSSPIKAVTVENFMQDLIGDESSDLYGFQLGKFGTLIPLQGDGIVRTDDDSVNYTITPMRFSSAARFCSGLRDWDLVAPIQNTTAPTKSPVQPVDSDAPLLATESVIALAIVIPLFIIMVVVLFFRLKKKSKQFRKFLGLNQALEPQESAIDPVKKPDSSNPNFAQFKDL